MKREPGARLGRRFLTVWAGQTLSAIGSVLSGVGVAVYVYVTTGDVAWLGVLAATASVPYVLAGPFVRIADRFPRRTVMVGADAFAAIGPAIALGLALTGRLAVWHLAAAGFLAGLGNAVQWPAAQAAVPTLVAPEALGRANGLSQLGPAMGVVLGPVLATPLVAWWGIEAVLLTDLVTFTIAVACTLSVRFGPVPLDPASGPVRLADSGSPDDPVGGILADDGSWRTAWRWLRGPGRAILGLIGVAAVVNFALAFFNVAAMVLATDVGGAARAGLALGAGGVAMVAGSLVVGRRGVAPDRIGTCVRALVLFAAGSAVAAARPAFGLVAAGMAIALAGVPAVNAAVSTLYHERVPASMHGRVFGLRAASSRALEPVGSALAGFALAHLAGPALAPGGPLAGTMGPVLGTGRDRGAALVMLGVAAAVFAVAAWLARSWIARDLAARPDQLPGDVASPVAAG